MRCAFLEGKDSFYTNLYDRLKIVSAGIRTTDLWIITIIIITLICLFITDSGFQKRNDGQGLRVDHDGLVLA